MNHSSRVIAVFAHNEEKKILSCLKSIKNALNSREGQCFVLVNGSTDNTVKIVSEFAKENNFCELVDIKAGDKSNAWNVFIHDISVDAGIYYFVDGDCEILPDSLDKLERCLANCELANAAAAIPEDVGIYTKRTIESMIMNGGLAGNLYALSKNFIARIRQEKVYLPFGWIGDDSLLGALAYWNLDPKQKWDKRRIVVCKEAKFTYTPLSVFSISDLLLYYRRKRRYSLRHFQIQLLRSPMKRDGLAAIPRHVNELYEREFDKLKLAWRGLNTWFDWLTIKSIKNSINRSSGRS